MTSFFKNNIIIIHPAVMDCGPICLWKIAKFYNKNYSFEEIKKLFNYTDEGVSILDLKNVAENIGFESLAINIETQKLFNTAILPCIIHIHRDHFVVLDRIEKNIFYIDDPNRCIIQMDRITFEKSWITENGKGNVLLLQPIPSK